MRCFWKSDEGQLPDLASRLTASGDIYNRRGRRPWSSVNFITAHDGFTLNDLVSYHDKRNEANGEDNCDGHSHNRNWNHGHEGPTSDPVIRALRERQKRNFLATLLLSCGTPMMLAGDEFGRTQHGNNNAYCQDNEISWIDWEGIDADGQALAEFVRKLTELRQSYPVLHRVRYLTGAYNSDLSVKDATWLTPAATEMGPEQWAEAHARCLGLLLDGRAQPTGIKKPGSDATLLLVVNSHHDVVPFTLPKVIGGREWLCLIDTHLPDRDEPFPVRSGDVYDVTGRSLLLFVLKPGKRSRRILQTVADMTQKESEATLSEMYERDRIGVTVVEGK